MRASRTPPPARGQARGRALDRPPSPVVDQHPHAGPVLGGSRSIQLNYRGSRRVYGSTEPDSLANASVPLGLAEPHRWRGKKRPHHRTGAPSHIRREPPRDSRLNSRRGHQEKVVVGGWARPLSSRAAVHLTPRAPGAIGQRTAPLPESPQNRGKSTRIPGGGVGGRDGRNPACSSGKRGLAAAPANAS